MANTLSPLSKDQIDNLVCEINGILEAELKDDSQHGLNFRNFNVVPTIETFDKAAVMNFLRILEPNSVIFFQDIQKLLQMHLDKDVLSFESKDGDYLKEKYFIRDDTNSITLARVAAVFPSLTCNLLKRNQHIARPIAQHELVDSGSYPKSMTTRCFFSLIPLTPLNGKLRFIEAALLYQLLEQAKFNTLKLENGQVNYSEHMGICMDYCSNDYLSEYEANEKRIQHFDELELMKYGFPIPPVYEASDRLRAILGKMFMNEIITKFKLIAADLN